MILVRTVDFNEKIMIIKNWIVMCKFPIKAYIYIFPTTNFLLSDTAWCHSLNIYYCYMEIYHWSVLIINLLQYFVLYEKCEFKVNKSRYIELFVVSRSIEKLFLSDCVSICLFLIIFSIDFARSKSTRGFSQLIVSI